MARQLYKKVHEEWKDKPDKTTPVLAADLGHIEQGIYDNSDKMALKEIYGDENMLLGYGNTSTGKYNALAGSSNTVNGGGNASFGIGNKIGETASTDDNLISGKSNKIKSGQGGNAVSGMNNIVAGSGNMVSGISNDVNGFNNLVTGSANASTGANGIMSGERNTDSGYYNAVFGIGNKASGGASFIHGRYNVEDTIGQYVDIVGGGTPNDRKNIYTLDWEGNAVFSGDVTTASGASLNNIGTPETLDIDFSNYFN